MNTDRDFDRSAAADWLAGSYSAEELARRMLRLTDLRFSPAVEAELVHVLSSFGAVVLGRELAENVCSPADLPDCPEGCAPGTPGSRVGRSPRRGRREVAVERESIRCGRGSGRRRVVQIPNNSGTLSAVPREKAGRIHAPVDPTHTEAVPADHRTGSAKQPWKRAGNGKPGYVAACSAGERDVDQGGRPCGSAEAGDREPTRVPRPAVPRPGLTCDL